MNNGKQLMETTGLKDNRQRPWSTTPTQHDMGEGDMNMTLCEKNGPT